MRYKVYLRNPSIGIKKYNFFRFDTIKNTGSYLDINNDFIYKNNITIYDWDITYAKETDFNNFVFSYNSKEEAIKQYNQFKKDYPELFI